MVGTERMAFRVSRQCFRPVCAAAEFEMEALRQKNAADAVWRKSEARARNLSASLIEAGRDLAKARRELAALRASQYLMFLRLIL